MSKLIINQPTLWLGSEETFDAVLDAHKRLAALEALGPDAIGAKMIEFRGGKESADPFAMPPLYEVKDGVAVLTINGPLIMGSAGFMRLFGILGYDDIREAAFEAMSQKSVKSMLMCIGSGGGHAAGCEDMSMTLRKLGEQKPLHTYTDSIMGSAAYWVGSAGKHIGTSKTALLGSIGAIQIHTEYSVQDAKEGITRTVMRAGEHKAPVNPYEKLTPEARAEAERKLETMYDVFADGVCENLGMERKKFDATAGRGREFLGVEAVKVGLAHTIMSYDEAHAYAKSVDSSKLNSQNSRIPKKDSVMKATLATSILLALAGGALPASLDLTKADANMSGEVPDAEAQTLLRAQAIEVRAALDAGQAAAIKAATEPLTGELNTLKATHATVNTELAGLRTTNAALLAQTTQLEADVAASEKVLRASIVGMTVALGAADTSKELTGSALVAEHARLETAFATKFPNARISAVTTEADPKLNTVAAGEIPEFVRTAQRLHAARSK